MQVIVLGPAGGAVTGLGPERMPTVSLEGGYDKQTHACQNDPEAHPP